MSTVAVEQDNPASPFEGITVGQLVAERPGRARILENYGLDYCCGGKKLLAQVCEEKGLDFPLLSREILAYDATHVAQGTDWTHASLTELADHISSVHHAYLQLELPRLEYLADRVFNAHGQKYSHLAELREVVHHLSNELLAHTNKEEKVLFPWIKKLEAASSASELEGASVSNPIAVMEAEHAEAGADLEKIRKLTNSYIPPSDTCNTHRVYLSSLQELEQDLHIHINKENSILFPRAIIREKELRN